MANKSVKERSGNQVAPVELAPENPVTQQPLHEEEDLDLSYSDADDESQIEVMFSPVTLSLGKTLIRKLTDIARDEGITPHELAAELIAEGVVLRAWEIVEKKATMRGGSSNNQNFNRPGNNPNGNQAHGNQGSHSNNNQRQPFQGGNKMAHKKLQRQARQHANAMDLMSDKAAFIEYVRNQEKKRR
jgi:hypothetical protein